MANFWKRAFARADNITAEIEESAKSLRPDIRLAVLARRHATEVECSRPEILSLESRLQSEETVRLLTNGNGVCLVVLTDRRLLILNDSEKKRVRVAYSLAEIRNVSWHGGVAFGKLTFSVAGAPVAITNVPKWEGPGLFDLIDSEVAEL